MKDWQEEKEESCCSIDYEHHKEIFERRRRAFMEHPEKAVTSWKLTAASVR